MIYTEYMAKKRAYINGKLYIQGDVLKHYPGLEKRKSFRGIGEPLIADEEIDNDEEDTNEDEIKRGFRGSWKLPNGDVFTGKRTEAKEHWNKIKNN
jgi:hypothetical protein